LIAVALKGPGDGVAIKLPQGYPRTAVRIELTVNYTAPGTILDTVGLNAAPIGAWALVVNGDGRISMNVYDPGRQSPRRVSNGWHLLTSKPVAARVDHLIRVEHSGTELVLSVDGAFGRMGLATPLSGQPVFIGDYPGDERWAPRLKTKLGMTGRIILHTFGPSAPEAPSSSGQMKNTPQPLPLPSDKPATPNEPIGAISTDVRSPADVAYVHFLNEMHRHRGGKISVGSPRSSPTRVEVAVTADGTTEKLVVLEKTNTGTQATVVVGNKDAGGFRTYTLKREANGWVISRFQDLDQ
jgi:hypothetical protein